MSMRTVSAGWPALFAIGAGLLHVALGASLSATGRWPAWTLMGLLLALGSGELAWGAASLRAGRCPAPRTSVAAALAGIVLSGLSIGAGCSPVAVAASTALTVPAAVLVARPPRRTEDSSRPASAVAGLVVGAVIVAALVTPALSTTGAVIRGGRVAVTSYDPHAGH